MEKTKLTTIRFDEDIYECVKEIAKKYNRSFGKQINFILRKYCDVYKKVGVPIIDLFEDYEHDKILEALKKLRQH